MTGQARALAAALLGIEGRHHAAVAIEQSHGDHALGIAHLPDQSLEQQLPIEVALIHCEQRLLGGACQIGDEGAAALLHLRFERPALVLGRDEGEARARHDQERDHQSAELDLKRDHEEIRL
jgi:hypothetical protein